MPAYAAVVLSGGTGSRMKSDIPKQYLEIHGKPVIYYSLKAFQDSNVSEIVLVTGKGWEEYCRTEIVEKYALTKVKKIVIGGKERYDSVLAGLRAITAADYILIHDGARPMLTEDIINRTEECARKYRACVAGMPSKDTIRITDTENYGIETTDRRHTWIVQTPQTFEYQLIRDAYEQMIADMQAGKNMPAITDDAMAVEYTTGLKVKFTEGSYRNIKITTPEDLAVADLYL